MTGIDLGQAATKATQENPSLDLDHIRGIAEAQVKREASAVAARHRASAGLAAWATPGGVPQKLLTGVEYAGTTIAEGAADAVLSLGSGLLYRWPAWLINKGSALTHWASGSDPKSPFQPTDIDTGEVPTLRSVMTWMDGGAYERASDYARRQFEGDPGDPGFMMGARMVAQEAIGLFASFGGVGKLGNVLTQAGSTTSKAVQAIDKVTGLPGRFVTGIGQVFATPEAAAKYDLIATRIANKVGMTVDQVNLARAQGRLTREVIAKMPVTKKVGAFLALKQREIAGTAAGLGALGVASGEADAGDAAATMVVTALTAPVMVGLGSIANSIQNKLGGGLGARITAGALEGAGFAPITMSPSELLRYSTALLDGDWETVGEATIRMLGQGIGMAALRGFSPDGLPAWRRNFPQDRAKPFKDLATNKDRADALQELGWVGQSVEGGAVEFRQPGRTGKFTMSEGEGGKLRLTLDGKELVGDDARDALRYIEARTAEEALLPHLHALPESWTETNPGVFRDVGAGREYALRAQRWVERDLHEGANAPWKDSKVQPPLLAPREMGPEIKDDLAELQRLSATAAREMSETARETKDALFHVELAEHLMAAVVHGKEGPARAEALAFLRSSPHLPAGQVLRSTARLFAGLSNATHELARGGRPDPPPEGPGGRPAERRAEDPARGVPESETLAKSADWSKASRAERRTTAAEWIQLRAQEGKETTDDDLRATFGAKSPRTRKKIRQLAGESPGARYGGERAPQAELEGEAGVKQITAMDASRAFRGRPEDPIKLPGREGGIKSKGALGVFHSFENVDRARVGFDFATRAHEWAHGMERSQPGGVGSQIPDALMAEATRIARYYGDATGRGLGTGELSPRELKAEVWAEYWARHILGDSKRLAEEAPEFHRWAQRWVDAQPKLKNQVDYLTDVMHRWSFQGARARARGMVFNPSDPRTPEQIAVEGTRLQQAIRSFDKHWLDASSDLRRVEKELGKSRDTRPSLSPYKTQRLFAMGAGAEAERMLLFGTHDVLGRRTGESMKELWDAIPEAEHREVAELAVALREAELQSRGFVASGTKQELAARIQSLKGDRTYTVGGEQLTRAEIVRRMNDFYGRVLDYLVGHGAFDAPTADIIKNTSKYYTPFYRQFFEDAPAGTADGHGGPAVRRMRTGGVRPVLDPRKAVEKWTVHAVTAAHQAAIRKSLVTNIAERSMGSLVQEVKRDMVPDDFPIKKLLNEIAAIKEKGGKEAEGQALRELADLTLEAETLQYWHQAEHPSSKRPWFTYTPHWSEADIAEVASRDAKAADYMRLKNNKELWFEVDPRIYELVGGSAFGSAGRGWFAASIAGRFLRGSASAVRLGVTGLSPVFTVRNLIRDVLTYPLYATRGGDPLKEWMRKLGPFEGFAVFLDTVNEMRRGSELYSIFKARGGHMARLIKSEMAASSPSPDVFRQTTTALGKMREGVTKVVEWLSSPEGVLRFAEMKNVYHKRMREGWAEQDAINDAMLAAKEVTINFTAGGIAARAMNQYVPYFNAHLQGQRKFWNNALGFEGKRQRNRAVVSALVNMTFMSTASWLSMKLLGKEDQWNALDRQKRGKYWYFFLPGMDGPIEIPKPFEAGMLFSHPIERMLDEIGGTNPTDMMEWALDFAGGVIGPFWPGKILDYVPAGAKPLAEVIANRNFFTGREIVPDWLSAREHPGQQANKWNTAASKLLGDTFGISPAKMDHLLGGYTGGLWTSANRWAEDVGSFLAGGEVKVRDLTGGLSQMVPHPYKGSQQVGDIYENIKELRRGDPSGPDKRKLRILERATDRMADVRKRQATMSRATLDAELHRIATDALKRAGL